MTTTIIPAWSRCRLALGRYSEDTKGGSGVSARVRARVHTVCRVNHNVVDTTASERSLSRSEASHIADRPCSGHPVLRTVGWCGSSRQEVHPSSPSQAERVSSAARCRRQPSPLAWLAVVLCFMPSPAPRLSPRRLGTWLHRRDDGPWRTVTRGPSALGWRGSSSPSSVSWLCDCFRALSLKGLTTRDHK